MQNVVNDLPEVDLYASGPSQNSVKSNKTVPLDLELVNASIEPVPQSIQKCTNFNDKLLYIYTSGTTGLPKAAVIKNSRCVSYSKYCNVSIKYLEVHAVLPRVTCTLVLRHLQGVPIENCQTEIALVLKLCMSDPML